MLQEPATLALSVVKPVNGAAFVGENLLEVANGKRLYLGGGSLIEEAPHSIEVVVLGEHLHQLGVAAGDDVDHTARQVTGVEQLIKITDDERIKFRRNGNNRVAHSDGGKHGGEKSQ